MDHSNPTQDVDCGKNEIEDALSLKSSDPDKTDKRFDVLCILTKSNASAILNPEFHKHVMAMNFDMKDLTFLYFPKIYELCARSEQGPDNFDVFTFGPEGLEREHRLTAEEAAALNEQLRAARARGEDYDITMPIIEGKDGLILQTKKLPEYEACEAPNWKEAVDTETRYLMDRLQEAMQEDQTIESSIKYLFAALEVYGEYVYYQGIDLHQSVIESAKAIIAQSKGEKGTLPNLGTDTAIASAEKPDDMDTKRLDELLKKLVLQAADHYNKQYLATESEVDADLVEAAERILTQSTRTLEAIPEETTSEKKLSVHASGKTEAESKANTQAN